MTNAPSDAIDYKHDCRYYLGGGGLPVSIAIKTDWLHELELNLGSEVFTQAEKAVPELNGGKYKAIFMNR